MSLVDAITYSASQMKENFNKIKEGFNNSDSPQSINMGDGAGAALSVMFVLFLFVFIFAILILVLAIRAIGILFPGENNSTLRIILIILLFTPVGGIISLPLIIASLVKG
jgi:uncharacterized integral membrane protein